MTKFAVFTSAIVISWATSAWASVTPVILASTNTSAASDTENQPYGGAAKVGQRKKTYMTPTANPMRTENCAALEMSGQATLNGQPTNAAAASATNDAGTGAKATGQGINKGSGSSAHCWEEPGTERPASQY